MAFALIASIFIIAQYFTLHFVNRGSNKIGIKDSTLHFDAIRRTVSVAQYILAAFLLVAVFQMAVASHYYVVIISGITSVSFTLAFATMGILAWRFFRWYRSKKDATVVLYGLSSATLAAKNTFMLGFMLPVLSSRPSEIGEHSSIYAYFAVGSIPYISSYGLDISTIISFILMWITTVMLLHHYSTSLGKAKYWVLICIPLLYFLSQFAILYSGAFGSLLQINPTSISIIVSIIFTMSLPIGGLLFGGAFFIIARRIPPGNIVKNYLALYGCGIMLFFIPGQVNLINSPYPPFGLVALSSIGLASYLILVGLYSSAISISHDKKLRQSIRKFVRAKLLDNIALAQMEEEMNKEVVKLVKENSEILGAQTGVYPSLSEEDIKHYLQTVLEETKKVSHQ